MPLPIIFDTGGPTDCGGDSVLPLVRPLTGVEPSVLGVKPSVSRLCRISLYLGSSGILGELRLLFLFAIWLINAGTPAVNPVAASEPIAPSNGFAIRSLFVETYEDTF